MVFWNKGKANRVFVFLLSICLMFSSVFFLPISQVHAATQATYYVDPVNGLDTNDGTTTITAFRTIEKARDVVRTVNANMTGDLYVYLRGGTYNLASTLTLTDADSGTNGYNINYSAYNGEKPLISGGKQITGWTLHDASKNIYKASAGGDIQTRQLFVNGKRATRARSTGAPSPLTFVKASGYTATGNVLANSTIPMHNWGNKSDIEFVYKNQWTAPRIGVSTITNNGTTTTFTMKQPGWQFVTNKGGTSVGGSFNGNGLPWYIENAYELLDAEGEWYLDRTTDTFYYKPKAGENMSTATIVAPVLEELVRVEGSDLDHKAHNIQFKGITFSHATYLRVSGDGGLPDAQNNVIRDTIKDANGNDVARETIINAAVNLRYAHSIKFERDIFEHLGGSGLNMYTGSQDNLVVGSVFTDISGNGIQVGDYTGLYTAGTENYAQSTDPRVMLRNNDVNNSYFYKIGAEYFASTAIAASLPQDMDITHNEISNVPYSAIHVGWGWSTLPYTVHQRTNIQYNYIHDDMMLLADGGAIYTNGPTNGSSTNKGIISNNYIQNEGNTNGALYPDEGSSWYDITDNVVNNSSRYLLIWKNTIHDINVNNTYTTTSNSTNAGTNTKVTNTTVVSNGNWPSAAIAIMNNAGIESTYADIKPALPPSAQPAATQLLFQNFNGETTGSSPAGWTTDQNGGTIQVAAVPDATNKSIQFNKTVASTNAMNASKSFIQVATGSVELKARAEQTNANSTIALLSDQANTSLIAVQFNSNGKISYMKNNAWQDTDVSYTAGTWYKIKIVFNSDTDTFDLYVDDILKLKDEPFIAEGGKVTKLSIGMNQDEIGTMYVDDVDVFSYLIAPTQVSFQNFDTETTGSAPANWTSTPNGGTIQIAEVPSASDKSMRLRKTSSSSANMGASKTFSPVTSGILELRARADQTNAYGYIAVLSDASGGAGAFIAFEPNGKIGYQKAGTWIDTSVAYSAGKWYTIKIIFNTILGKFDLFIDGVKVLDQQPVLSGDVVTLATAIYRTNVGTMYIDNVNLFSIQDRTPPVTTDNAPKDWVNHDVTVALMATDADSGVADTFFTIDGGATQTGNNVAINSDGSHLLTYWSVDKKGNAEAPHAVVVNIDKTTPVTTAVLRGTQGANGWYTADPTVTLATYDLLSGVSGTQYRINNGSWENYVGPFTISEEGITTLTYRGIDQAGNTEETNTSIIKLDKTAPTLNVVLDQTSLWPANHKMVAVNATITANDELSQLASVKLLSITSNETDTGDDIQDAQFGTLDTAFSLRAERLGQGEGRIYTITYIATDQAGNQSTAQAKVIVPHDQRK